jgi:hypothetical protein
MCTFHSVAVNARIQAPQARLRLQTERSRRNSRPAMLAARMLLRRANESRTSSDRLQLRLRVQPLSSSTSTRWGGDMICCVGSSAHRRTALSRSLDAHGQTAPGLSVAAPMAWTTTPLNSGLTVDVARRLSALAARSNLTAPAEASFAREKRLQHRSPYVNTIPGVAMVARAVEAVGSTSRDHDPEG